MTFDNIKLEKGLYGTGKSFTQSLEAIDPSENYIGTELEGLDAYQRQLKRFDIKVSGKNSDSIEKFFRTSDSAALFPEYVSRAVAQGAEEADFISKIVATTTTIDGLDYRTIACPTVAEHNAEVVAEGLPLCRNVLQGLHRSWQPFPQVLHWMPRRLRPARQALWWAPLDHRSPTRLQNPAHRHFSGGLLWLYP